MSARQTLAMPDPSLVSRPVTRVSGGVLERRDDAVAVEGALEIRVDARVVSVGEGVTVGSRPLTISAVKAATTKTAAIATVGMLTLV